MENKTYNTTTQCINESSRSTNMNFKSANFNMINYSYQQNKSDHEILALWIFFKNSL